MGIREPLMAFVNSPFGFSSEYKGGIEESRHKNLPQPHASIMIIFGVAPCSIFTSVSIPHR